MGPYPQFLISPGQSSRISVSKHSPNTAASPGATLWFNAAMDSLTHVSSYSNAHIFTRNIHFLGNRYGYDKISKIFMVLQNVCTILL